MRAHKDELDAALTDSGTEEGISSGSEDGSPRLSDLDAPDCGGMLPFGRASDGDAPEASGPGCASAQSSGEDGSALSCGGARRRQEEGQSVEERRAAALAEDAEPQAAPEGPPPPLRESCSGCDGDGEGEAGATLAASWGADEPAASKRRCCGAPPWDGDSSDAVRTPQALTPEPPDVC